MPVALFDLDNTLFDRAGTVRRLAEAFAAARNLGDADIEWLIEADQDGFADRHQMWTEAKWRLSLAESVEELVQEYQDQYMAGIEPDEEVLGAMKSLRDAGWTIGIITNGGMPRQAEKAKALGLLAAADGFCASGEIGIAKPDPGIFVEVLHRCGVSEPEIEEVWMIGDSPTADVIGARELGFNVIWLHREREWDHEIGDAPQVSAASIPEAVSYLLGTVA